ncbi:ComF family protein [Actinomadura spongiicola]|uniref:ComF family protein n=1 Tax=Actinomadura spongiicola TaxID=2303421 RepID=UPI001314FD62|nr:hypothetical protein [Actinomadura spongiicola]
MPFSRCQNCSKYTRVLAGFIPTVYSLDFGLESMLHRYKDFGPQHRWMASPLANLAHGFLAAHCECIVDRYGAIDLATTVPSGSTYRGFDHMAEIISKVSSWSVDWDLQLLEKAKRGRPLRGVIDPSLYRAADVRRISRRSVLLFDDTWTSGSTIASAASVLRSAGARRVVAFTIGRQLKPGWGTSDSLIEAVESRRTSLGRCVICAQ